MRFLCDRFVHFPQNTLEILNLANVFVCDRHNLSMLLFEDLSADKKNTFNTNVLAQTKILIGRCSRIGQSILVFIRASFGCTFFYHLHLI